MKKALLVLGAGSDQLFMIKTAHAMSLETVAVDGNPAAPGLALATHSRPIDFSNVAAVIQYAEELIDQGVTLGGVLTMGSDVPHLLAEIAQHFQWVGPSVETGRVATDKYDMKLRFVERGVPVPRFSLVSSRDDIAGLWQSWGCRRLIVKPTDRAGSRGVRMISQPDEIQEAFDYAASFSLNQRIILEEYIEGPQISTESLLYDGTCVTPGFADRVYDNMAAFHPNIMENGGWIPSTLDVDMKARVETLVEQAARALGVEKGPAKGDVVICPQRGPMMIEMAARLSGGDFSESLVPYGCGINYVETAIEIAMGAEPDFNSLEPTKNQAVANRYFFPPPGKLEEIIGVEAIVTLPQVVKFELNYSPGQNIPIMTNHAQRAGVFIVVDKDIARVQALVDRIYSTIAFRIDGKICSGTPGDYPSSLLQSS